MERTELVSIQERLKRRLVLEALPCEPETVGGADLSYRGDLAYSTVTVLRYSDMELVEERTVKSRVSFPYVPGFLSFREAGPVIRTFKTLKKRPDVLLIDGQGIAHPRGIGLASHVGVLLDRPTIGVAKSPLVGEYLAPERPGAASPIEYGGQVVGYAYISKKGTRPLIISPGHRVSLESSLAVVKGCIRGHKLPEPLRLAHLLSKEAAKGQVSERLISHLGHE